jgi:two-component sensor histidine kinase
MTDTHSELAPLLTSPEFFPLSRRELVLIVAFWSGYAVLSIASRVFDRGGGATQHWQAVVLVAFSEAVCWMLLTPWLFTLASRLDATRSRATQIVVFALIGLGVAVLLGTLGTELRTMLTSPRSSSGTPPFGDSLAGAVRRLRLEGGAPPRGGPPVWFGILNALVLYLGVIAAGLARTYSRRYHLRREQAARREARLEAQLAEARLDALRRQLDPHFLFNTLNAVSALVERDPRGVRRMIVRLSELLRHSVEGAREAEVTLRAELAMLTRYVEIMQVRFQGRLTVETRVDDRALDALVPSMILQPLVENAMKHGIERASGPGMIDVEADVDGDELLLRVRDNGPAVSEPADPTGQYGVGLRNTVARLEQLYGVANRFTMTHGAGGGTVVELRLPFHLQSAAATSRASDGDVGVSGKEPAGGGGARVE